MPSLPTPPRTRVGGDVDTFHGIEIADPYRWLETTTDPEVRDWIVAQNKVTNAHLDAIGSLRDGLRARISELWNRPRRSVPWRRESTWLQLRNDGLQDQDVLWTASADPLATGTPDTLPPDHHWYVLVDPNTWTEDGTAALTSMALTADGQLLAYARSDAGSDWMTWRVVDCGTAVDLGEEVRWAKFAGAVWLPDGSGFVYGGYPAPAEGREHLDEMRGHQLRVHRLGHPDDEVLYERPDQPDWLFSPDVAHDDAWLVITIQSGTNTFTRVHLAPITDGTSIGDVTPWLDEGDAAWHVVGALGDELVVVTDKHAPTSRVVAIATADATQRREVVAATDDRLESARIIGAASPGDEGRLLLQRLHHAAGVLAVHELDGTHVTNVDLGDLATIGVSSGGRHDTAVFVPVTTFAAPGGIRRIEVLGEDTGATSTVFAAPLDSDVEVVTTRVFVEHDGPSADAGPIRVPVFLTHRADVDPTGEVPTILSGYGGFDIPITPTFSATWRTWVERGGLLAVACLRGGGEYGKGWYDDGRLANKQHVFDDALAVADWLGGASGWTSSAHLAIEGRSNGGLLVGACLTQRPDLFGCAVPEVGVLDLYRYHLFTIGWAWASDYGTVDDPDHFAWLQRWSPLHNVREQAYPPTLMTTGDTDDRVVPGHSFKFAASLQAAQTGDAPVLVRIDTSAGHGAGKPTSKLIDERADVLSFQAHHLGLT